MSVLWLAINPALVLVVLTAAMGLARHGVVAIGVAVLAVSCLAALGATVLFVTPYGGVCLRVASSIRRSMLGYAGWARLTARQRSSAAS